MTTTYGYGTGNDLLQTLSVNGTVTQTIGYTADGRMASFSPGLQSPGGQNTTALSYNQDGQLSAANSGSEAVGSYTYNGFGQRVSVPVRDFWAESSSFWAGMTILGKALHSYSRMSHPIWIYIFGPREGWAIVAALSIWSVFVLARMLDAPADSRRFSVAVSLALASTIAVIPVYSAQIYNNIFLFPALLLLLSSCGTGPVARIFRVAAFATSSLMIVAPVLGAPVALAFPSVPIPALLLFACMPMIVFVFPAAMLGNKLSFETHNHATPSSGCIGATRPRSGGR